MPALIKPDVVRAHTLENAMHFRPSFYAVPATPTWFGPLRPLGTWRLLGPLLLLGIVLLLGGCSSLSSPSATVAASSSTEAKREAKREAKAEVCRQAHQTFRQALSQGHTEKARREAEGLFRNAACATRLTYLPVWSLRDLTRDESLLRTYIAQARKSSLAEDASLAGQAARAYLTTVELYLGAEFEAASRALRALEAQLDTGAYQDEPALQQLARSQIMFLQAVIAERRAQRSDFQACVSYWESPEEWKPQELKTGLYYQLAVRMQKVFARVWSGLNDMHAQRLMAGSRVKGSDALETLVSPKLFEARVLIDELFYEFSRPEYQPIVETFQMEQVPELALKGVNDIIDAYYASADEYRGQFQSGTAYLIRAREISDKFLRDVHRRIAESRQGGCADQF